MGVMVKNKVARFFMDHGVVSYHLFCSFHLFLYTHEEARPRTLPIDLRPPVITCDSFLYSHVTIQIYNSFYSLFLLYVYNSYCIGRAMDFCLK